MCHGITAPSYARNFSETSRTWSRYGEPIPGTASCHASWAALYPGRAAWRSASAAGSTEPDASFAFSCPRRSSWATRFSGEAHAAAVAGAWCPSSPAAFSRAYEPVSYAATLTCAWRPSHAPSAFSSTGYAPWHATITLSRSSFCSHYPPTPPWATRYG